MARRRRGHRSGGMKLPIVSLAILGGQAFYAANAAGGDLKGSLAVFGKLYTGFNFQNGQFEPAALAIGYGPWLLKRFILPIARPRLGGVHLPVSLS